MEQIKNKKSPNEFETFGDMVSFLESVPNCRINGKGFYVLDLRLFLDKHIESIELIPLEQRKGNINCESMKESLKKVLNAYLEGNIEKAGTVHKSKKVFSIWAT